MRPTLDVTFFFAEHIVFKRRSQALRRSLSEGMQVHPFHLNKVKPDPKGPTYFSGCCWHRRDPANFCKIRLTVLSKRVSILVKIACRIYHNWPHFMVRGSKLILLCCLPLPLILKGQARPLSKIKIKLLGGSNKNATRQKWEPPFAENCWVLSISATSGEICFSQKGSFWVPFNSIYGGGVPEHPPSLRYQIDTLLLNVRRFSVLIA